MQEQKKGKSVSEKNNVNNKEVKDNNKDTVTIARSEYDSLKQDRENASEYWNRLLRRQAEFENIKKRLEKEKQDFVKFANERLISDLLTVLDDLERSFEIAQQEKGDFQGFIKGIELILGHLYEIMKKRGLSPIEAEGKLFDPEYHEALLHVDRNDLPEHTIVEELQKGYLLNGKVLRTAKVKVSKKKSEEQEG